MVSIIMPAQNREAYLAETIDSILAQSYKDWELIIVDDASTDGSQYLYDYYTKKDKRIKVFYLTKSRGIAFARNFGIDMADGDYIAVMDSDDVMIVDRLKLSLKGIKNHDFVYSDYGIFSGGEVKVYKSKPKMTIEDVKANGCWPHVTIMAKRECFEECPYREEFKVNDDAGLVFDFFKAGFKSKYIKHPLVVVRYHDGSVSKTKQKEVERVNQIIQQEIRDYLREPSATN